MYGNKLRSIMLLGLVWFMTPAVSPAIDVNPSQGSDITEAARLFANLAKTSRNPVVVSMAQENLRKLRGDADQGARRKSTEVALLPQSDNTFVVPAVVNKKYMATFLIDTGASYTVITPQMAESLGVAPSADSPTVPVTTANGVLNAPVVRLRNVSLGGMQVDNVDAVVTHLGDTPQISGLLGMSFFHGMELSFKQDKLVISR